ncbi:hypothetical protein LL320_002917 [Proteus mirabilis]|nr:hypothetical protein [Proteus mirabilis]ELA7801371.1 hypothetical protein [Proteus mirabilis]HEK0646005.1 hypothetical protein [Proteus mirabilis]
MSGGDWLSGISIFASVVSAIGTAITAYIAYRALNVWVPEREVRYRDAFITSILHYKACVKSLPQYIDEKNHSELLDELSQAKLECDKNWCFVDYRKNKSLFNCYTRINSHHVMVMGFQIEQNELLDCCYEMISLLLDEQQISHIYILNN